MKQWFLGKDLWHSRFRIMTLTTFATMLWFILDWCMGSTFRSMSMWQLWVNNILASFLLTLPFMLSRKVWVQLVCLSLVDMLLIANLMYCRTYLTGIPFDSYFLVTNLKDFTASVWDSLRWADAGFPVILIAGAVTSSRMPRERFVAGLWPRYLSFVLVLSVVSFIGLQIRGGFYKSYNFLVEHAYMSSCGVPVYTVAGQICYNILDNNNKQNPEAMRHVADWLNTHNQATETVALNTHRKSLVIILLESFESWLIEADADGKPITPYLNALVQDSTTLYAPNMLTQVDAGRSIDAQLMITAGLLPTIGTVYSNRYPTNCYLTLNKALREKYGTKSLLLTVDQPITWNMGVVSHSFGYDLILDRTAWVTDEKVGNPPKLSDGSFFRQSVEKIKSDSLWPAGQPRMLTFVTYSGHNPFRLPEELRDPDFDLRGKGCNETLENYITMAHYTDSQLHTLIEYLRGRPDWNETLVLITGDHEGLAARRSEIINSGAKFSDLVSPEQFTPFILLNSPEAMRYENVLGQVDAYPTLLQMLGLENYRWQGVGESLLSPDKIPAAISSMTGKVVGDTTGINRERIEHWKDARRVSDAIIRNDYLHNIADR